jgi:hypothetical protein
LEEFILACQKEEKICLDKMELNLEITTSQRSVDRRRLPLELNCQIFECLKFRIQRNFIGGLGREIYGIFRHKVLKKVGINVWHIFCDYIWVKSALNFSPKESKILNKIAGKSQKLMP